MRPSVATNRAPNSTSLNSQANIAAAACKLLEKKKEFDAVSALERASALYLARIEGLSEDCDIMADAGQAHGQVLEQWPKMFQILSLFPQWKAHTVASRNAQDENSDSVEQSSPVDVDGQRLVRIPIEELQHTSP